MQSRRDILTHGLTIGGVMLWAPRLGAAPASGAAPAAIHSATAITQVFGEGQKLIAVALDYGVAVAGAGLSPADFTVEGRTVTAVYTASAPDPAARAASGRFVIVTLSREDAAAALKIPSKPPAGAPPAGAGGDGPPPATPPRSLGEGPPKGQMFRRGETTATQVARLHAAGMKKTIAPSAPVATTQVRNLIVDDFRQFTFIDPVTGDTLAYNLFIPKGYNKSRSYPLVLFMHDAGEISGNTTATLEQGLGAVVWASPEDQAKRPCFVLAPAYPKPMFIQSTYATSLLDTTVHLIEHLKQDWRIDATRIYNTGQSAGGMMSLAMDIKYPDLFAASFVVAGEWNPALTKPLARQKLWIVVSEGDEKAFPTETAIISVLEGEGTKIARAVLDGRSSPEQFATAIAAVEAQGAPVNFTPLRKGTVVPPGQRDNSGSNHVNTWRIAYTIEGVRAWLFQQRR